MLCTFGCKPSYWLIGVKMRLARNLLLPRLFHKCLLQSFICTTGAAGAGSTPLSGRVLKEMYCWADPNRESDVLGFFFQSLTRREKWTFWKRKVRQKESCLVHISRWMFRSALPNAGIKALGIHGHFQGCCDIATPVYDLCLTQGFYSPWKSLLLFNQLWSGRESGRSNMI